eukprot:CAMPEP_0198223514 /NCGR_PEP_ID=MMETSP1445-20131203/92844_1 /TAXON_ID=36898 /ORGANISM="Pyramimonas sp., Strain CCMP2087" /LENGTH=88 /DNA_ID=CAMNT_0043902367 /DNA_START=445 /DNA_END=708 /DNA_ORIENTATION=+
MATGTSVVTRAVTDSLSRECFSASSLAVCTLSWMVRVRLDPNGDTDAAGGPGDCSCFRLDRAALLELFLGQFKVFLGQFETLKKRRRE